MSVSLAKYSYAVSAFQGIVYRGEITRLGAHTVNIRVRSATGEYTGQDLSDIAAGHTYTFPRWCTDLYR